MSARSIFGVLLAPLAALDRGVPSHSSAILFLVGLGLAVGTLFGRLRTT